MDAFIEHAFMYNPPVSHNRPKVIKEIKAGKSGACVYELENNRILKTYLPRDHNWCFKSGTAKQKRDKYIGHRYEYAINYIRAIRDIVMTNILPDSMSPVVYDYGLFRSDKGLQPFIVMEKVRGTELFNYEPTGTDKDIRILRNIVKAVHEFNTCIRSYTNVQPCHKDLHPRNIFVDTCTNEVKLIDFDLSICPYDLLRTDESTTRLLCNTLVYKLMGNGIGVTKAYTHEHLHHTPNHIKEDADLYQLYSVFYYFSHHNKRLPKLMDALRRTSNKEEFMDTSTQVLNKLLENRVLKL